MSNTTHLTCVFWDSWAIKSISILAHAGFLFIRQRFHLTFHMMYLMYQGPQQTAVLSQVANLFTLT